MLQHNRTKKRPFSFSGILHKNSTLVVVIVVVVVLVEERIRTFYSTGKWYDMLVAAVVVEPDARNDDDTGK